MKQQPIETYVLELEKYVDKHPNWNGKIKRKENKKLYSWFKEIINGRRKINQEVKTKLINIGLDLSKMVANYEKLEFDKWLAILEKFLSENYYYGKKNNRKDKKHISEWDGTLKLNSGNFHNHNLYKWYQNVKQKKFEITDEEQKILEDLGLKLKSSISKRLSFEEWLKILKDFKNENGGDEWNGIVSTKIKKFKERNLYGFINSLRDKQLTSEQINKLNSIGLKNKLKRK